MKRKRQEIRAIYKGDIAYNDMPVFKYDSEQSSFIMLRDPEFKYGIEWIFLDSDFLIYLLTFNKEGEVEKIDFIDKNKITPDLF